MTGANRGIGKAILTRFAETGANIFACVRTGSDEFESYCKNISKINGVWIKIIVMELTDVEQVKLAVKRIKSDKQVIDILVNNAGITYNSLFQMSTKNCAENVFNVNYFSVLWFSQYIVKLMVQQGHGNIINISSTAAIDANPGRSIYASSKASLISTTKVMSNELAKSGIRVNSIAPGITDTDMVEKSMTDEVIAETIAKTKLKRIGKPVDIANTAIFLGSDLSSYITGQVIRVDGGLER